MDDDELWLRLGRRRRFRRRAGWVAGALTGAALLLAPQVADGPPDVLPLGLLVLLLATVGAGWWWLERQAGESPRRLLAGRRDGSAAAADLADDAGEARADHALRHGLPAPPGARARVLAKAEKEASDARAGLWLSPFYLALGVLWVLRAADDGWRAVLGVTWVVLAVVLAGKAVRDRRTARRWLAAHGSEVVADGRRSS
ncbi:hypothetical protein [Klenkia taihuensis]|uniref:Uncharacterized protein n=1 Tax=Klenkia taihuensis TaxID=1225127 RepID=A0A1I1TDS8_9ACTN|nr:hypothetical protein [Klenkia taihuensis]GHE12849.1 hypothetical protein GCM10011381_32300 [Klenkia taihuensis]SFD56755.1 hypothetical protein SAMN05661030_3745 [Klenkia taihuensis]